MRDLARRLLPYLTVLSALFGTVEAEAAAGQTVAGEWRGDVDTLLSILHRAHPDPYWGHSAAEFESAAIALKQELPSLSPARAMLELQRLLALTEDGHSGWTTLPESLRGRYLPMLFRRFEEGWFVITADTTLRPLFGKPIVTFAGHPVEEAIARVMPYLSGDNPLMKLDDAANLLRNVGVLHALGLVADLAEAVDVAVRERDGTETRVRVPVTDASWVSPGWRDVNNLLNPDVPEILANSLDGNYGCAWLPEDGTVYVMFSEIRDDPGAPSIAAFFDSVYAFTRNAPADRLVLDLRENSGGNLDLVGPVIRGVIAMPEIDRPGRFFVLIGRDTFSAAMHLAVQLERYTHAIFVGTPTGATPNHFGDTEVFTLPASGLEIEVSVLYWQNSDPRDERPWITPDVPVTPSAADYLAVHDAALEAALTFEADSGFVRNFGPPAGRWHRATQVVEPDWPGLLGPGSGRIEPAALKPPRRGVRACETGPREG